MYFVKKWDVDPSSLHKARIGNLHKELPKVSSAIEGQLSNPIIMHTKCRTDVSIIL
jgi:hypothetical protein